MSDQPGRPRFIESAERDQSPEEARQRRSKLMIALGVLAAIWGGFGFVAGSSTGSSAGLLVALLGIGLLIGGLIIRR